MHFIQKALAAIAVSSSVVLLGCSEEPDATSDKQPATASVTAPSHYVAERYEVGNDIYVRSLAVDAATDSLWVGTSSGLHQVALEDFSLKQTFSRDNGLANEYVFGIHVDNAGYKWFGTNAGGVSRYKDGEWKTFFPMHGLADYWVYTFTSQKDGTVWIGTWAGANSVEPETLEFTTYVDELINEWVYGLDTDSQDRVWFGTEGGVSMFDGNNWQSWNHSDGMGAPNENGLPPSKNTGLGTRERHDLGVLSAGMPTYNPNYVFSLIVDDKDVVWAGTWGAGVSYFDGKTWKNYTSNDGLANNLVYSILQDSEGNYWFGTAGGVSRFDGSSWKTFNRANGLLNNHVYALAETPNGDIWVGTKGGVSRIAKAN